MNNEKTLRYHLLKKFRQRWRDGNENFANSQAIQDWAHENVPHSKGKYSKYKHDTISRTLRKMAENKEIKAEIIDGKNTESVFYRYIPDEKEIISIMMKNENR